MSQFSCCPKTGGDLSRRVVFGGLTNGWDQGMNCQGKKEQWKDQRCENRTLETIVTNNTLALPRDLSTAADGVRSYTQSPIQYIYYMFLVRGVCEILVGCDCRRCAKRLSMSCSRVAGSILTSTGSSLMTAPAVERAHTFSARLRSVRSSRLSRDSGCQASRSLPVSLGSLSCLPVPWSIQQSRLITSGSTVRPLQYYCCLCFDGSFLTDLILITVLLDRSKSGASGQQGNNDVRAGPWLGSTEIVTLHAYVDNQIVSFIANNETAISAWVDPTL